MIAAGAFLISAGLLKFLQLLRIFEEFAHFVQLVIMCIQGSYIFVAFLVSWIFVFTTLFQVVGATFSADDYPGLHRFEVMLIQVYRNSIGDIAPPSYDLWYNPDVEREPLRHEMLMMKLIWLLWFVHQFFCMVMLLNFLISIISDYYN